ncbi:MAG: carbohydrate porin [Pirellulaceae bacterium]
MMYIRLAIVATAALLLAQSSASAQWCYDESCYGRETFTGDWRGKRTSLAESGITFDLDHAHFYQGVAHGGLNQRFDYGGHGDYVTNVDFGKMGLQEGLYLKIRAEHRFGETINGDTGAVLPAAILPEFPVSDDNDILISNFLFTQFIEERFAVFFGKLDSLDGDMNAFAHGRGKTQFLNGSFVATPIAIRTVPYSTLGCGFMIMGEDQEPLFSYAVLNSTDTSETAGFNELFADGVAMTAELRLPTNFFNMPGHQLFGATWNSREYVALDQDPRKIFPEVPINETRGSWSMYWNFDHYLHVDACDSTKGWGLFGRAAMADANTNPLEYFFSFGVGGYNPYCSHRNDTFGLGWFMHVPSEEIGPALEETLGPINQGHGVELYYNCEVTKWLHVTPDFQVMVPARENVDTAIAVGVRAVMQF